MMAQRKELSRIGLKTERQPLTQKNKENEKGNNSPNHCAHLRRPYYGTFARSILFIIKSIKHEKEKRNKTKKS